MNGDKLKKNKLEYRASYFVFVLSIQLKDSSDNSKLYYVVKDFFLYFHTPKTPKQTQNKTKSHQTTEQAEVISFLTRCNKEAWNASKHASNNTAVIVRA